MSRESRRSIAVFRVLFFLSVLPEETVVFSAGDPEVEVEANGHDQEDEEKDDDEQDPRPKKSVNLQYESNI